MPTSETERGLNHLEAEMKRLEAEYNMYFAGRAPKPPWETRSRVEALVKHYDRLHIPNTGERFRFTTLQTRFVALVDLWDRGLRAREEGRSGPFRPAKSVEEARLPGNRVMHVAAFREPMEEMDKLHDLYASLIEARRQTGADGLSFQRFADLVKAQVHRMSPEGSREIAFRVSVRDGKAHLTARVMKGDDGD